ncbi:hypothetical protein [Streptomyces sp. NEAU-H3]|uniref:hypothetical protein n=1 Tax=Streptomyces sp. NEAU-H3 TaxID=2720636 RepID=UPI001FD84ED5|nr:hypothetical protein [Streptomyces sp. NEAU-H3]
MRFVLGVLPLGKGKTAFADRVVPADACTVGGGTVGAVLNAGGDPDLLAVAAREERLAGLLELVRVERASCTVAHLVAVVEDAARSDLAQEGFLRADARRVCRR